MPSSSRRRAMAQAPDSGRLFQEDLKSDPFWMLVACILINRTHWRQVKPVLERLRERCPQPQRFLVCPVEEMIEIVRPLGFYNRRTSLLRRFALSWGDQPPQTWQEVMRMPGCGEYAAQSWQIFVQNEFPIGTVTDHKLQWYLDRQVEVMQ